MAPGRGLWSAACALISLSIGASAAAQRVPLTELEILQEGHPRAFFFRTTTVPGTSQLTQEEFNAAFSQLNGVMGADPSANQVEVIRAFKTAHPRQLIYLMHNASERRPDSEPLAFDGHWLYFNGTALTADVNTAETVFPVEDTSVFRTEVGNYGNVNDDIGICLVDDQGRPDWSVAEQLRLVAIDSVGGTITVERAVLGSTALPFPAGAYLAAHVAQGPWSATSTQRTWATNMATTCPLDPVSGLPLHDLLIENREFSAPFNDGEPLALFDAIQFDVMSWLHGNVDGPGRDIDIDADGVADLCVVEWENVYGPGVVEFARQLRDEPEFATRLITGDGQSFSNQRAYRYLSGIENEGFPMGWDNEMRDWSGGLNRQRFWDAERSADPAFSYIMFKTGETPEPDPDYSMGRIRLSFAVGPLLDRALTFFHEAPREPGDDVGIWDELIKGQEKEKNWLGHPTTETVDLATTTPDLLEGEGVAMTQAFVDRWNSWSGAPVAIERVQHPQHGWCVRFTPTFAGGPEETTATAVLPLDLPAGEVVVYAEVWADPHPGYSGRQISLVLNGNTQELSVGAVRSWVDERPFTITGYWREVDPAIAKLRVTLHRVEGGKPYYLKNLQLFSATQALARGFERGAVLANPALHSYTFDLEALFPGQRFRRLIGSPSQDPITNDGESVGATIELGERDAIFLVLEEEPESDGGQPDSGESDAGLPDVGESDAGLPDTGESDTGEPDTGLPDAGEEGLRINAGGCACSGTASTHPLALLFAPLLIVLARRRRRQ